LIEEETAGRLDFEALRYAIEERDPDLLLGFYSDDAELRIVISGAPESPAFQLRGRAEIARCLRAVFGHRTPGSVEGEVVGEARISFSEVYEYPDGTRIVVNTTLELSEGRISRQRRGIVFTRGFDPHVTREPRSLDQARGERNFP
jgi:hypothetical protein